MNKHSIYLASLVRERRLDYRVHYPAAICPKMSLFGHLRDVLDISSSGMCFSSIHGDLAKVGRAITSEVVFPDGAAQTVRGRIIHLNRDAVSVSLWQGFDFNVIVRERLAVMSITDIGDRAKGTFTSTPT
jgi:hypothetical protein